MKNLFLLIIFVCVVGCFDRMRSTFRTYQDLNESGLVEKGWIPSDFPKNVFNIIEEHDLDINCV